jgi:voltage-dependent potassium channel beta subunit
MEVRRLGTTGLKLSELSLGTWLTFGEQLTEAEAGRILRRAYDLAVNFFDTADIYARGEAERILGRCLRQFPRSSLVIASKVFRETMPGPNGRGLSRKHIFESCHASLERLGLDYLDIYFCHAFDAETPIEETVRAMGDLVRQGKILYWGTSNWRGLHLSEAIAIARQLRIPPPVVEQPEYNLLCRERVEQDLAPLASSTGIGLVTYAPLRSGLLTGKYNDGPPPGTRLAYREWLRPILTDPAALDKVRRLTALAGTVGLPLAQLATAWLLLRPYVSSVILGASSLRHLEDNLAAAEIRDRVTPDVLERIEQILAPSA